MGDVVQLRAGPDTIQIDADSVAVLRGRANKPCERCAGAAVFLVLCEPCFVGSIEKDVGDSLRAEGAAVAFGLMGMAEAIRSRPTGTCPNCSGSGWDVVLAPACMYCEGSGNEPTPRHSEEQGEQ